MNSSDPAYQFGYPSSCQRCAGLGTPCSLKVAPFFQPGGPARIVLIGQDPTIRFQSDRVHRVLMLDQPHAQLRRWLQKLLGEVFDTATIYATNVVKCTFDQAPSDARLDLTGYVEQCRAHLLEEIRSFGPTLAISLGERTHRAFAGLCKSPGDLHPDSMKDAFTGRFYSVEVAGHHFKYSPCLHIQTFRVAETYGDAVKAFKAALKGGAG